jgi:hypothetical protein
MRPLCGSSAASFRHQPTAATASPRPEACVGFGKTFGDLGQNTGLAGSLDSEHVGLKREYSSFA